LAFGTQAEALARADLAASWLFKGYLAQARNGKGVVFHIQDIQRM
jgi:primosomal replication protein N